MALAPLNDPKAEAAAENWRKVRRRLRVYFWILMLPALALLWGAGYAQGILHATAQRASQFCYGKDSK